ncbi:MAG: aspartyl protease family protein [Deltaproteobacteria bacterium]|nr:aspartyl protease family protein [Deltaproteobacteria bacterium]
MLLSVAIGLATVAIANGQMYRWVDDKGQLHFSNSPQAVPDEVRNKNNEYKPDTSSITINKTAKTSLDSGIDTSSQLSAKQQQKNTISIPYTANEGYASRVIIDVTFNGQVTVPMLVDTGSPGLVISNNLADRLNLFDEEGGRLMVVISGIGGQKMATKSIIDKLEIGGITEKFIPTHIVTGMSSSHYQGLIGMDVLSSYTMTIDPTQHRLIANPIPAAQDLPAGRSRSWWQANFREFGFYSEYWKRQEELMGKSDSAYARLPTSEKERIKNFILQQKNKATELYNKLESFARWNTVPRHWRR